MGASQSFGARESASSTNSSLSTPPHSLTAVGSTSRTGGYPAVELENVTYGGTFPWVDVHYKMKVAKGINPLQWLNALTKRLLVLGDISLASDGTFRHPADKSLLFPRGGYDLRWRHDSEQNRVVVDFWHEDQAQKWRWDELIPTPETETAGAAPDFCGIGHVGKFTFNFELLKAMGPISVDLDSPSEHPMNLEPISREGDSFNWWKLGFAEERKKGIDAVGSMFATPPSEAVLGQGGYGVVWLARNSGTGERYAVKNMLIRRRASDRAVAQNEFEIVEKIITQPHPHIVGFVSVDTFKITRGDLYMLVMEFCPGGDLDQVLVQCAKASTYKPPPEAFLWIGQIFLAMEHIHRKLKLLIRDLKPSNVILDDCRYAKITDFGFGRLMAEAPGGDWTFGVPPGTPGFAAPELLAKDSYGFPVDIYSFGVVAWVILSGGSRERERPAPPTAGRGSDFSTYKGDWMLLAAALKNPKAVRRPIDEETTAFISQLTQLLPKDRPDCAALRETIFFKEQVWREFECDGLLYEAPSP